jgi:glycosyltransferase involved in cell wall biosynthesis
MLLLARYLDREGYELAVVEQESDGPQTQLLAQRAGMRLLRVPYDQRTGMAKRVAALRRLLGEEQIALVHIHSPAAGGQLAPALAARLAGCHVMATYHQIQAWGMPAKTRVLNRLTHSLLVERTLAVSSDVRRTLVTNAGLSDGRIEVVPNGIELDIEQVEPQLPERKPGEVRFGYFGRLSPEKGVGLLLKAVAVAARTHPQVRAFIAGEGPQRIELEHLAAELQLGECVTFLGFRADARSLMREMDVVVHVPEYEGFGLVMIEAMAAGRPLIVNDAPGGMADLVKDGVNGIVVPAGDVERTAAAMARLADYASERARLGAKGRAICAERYSAEEMVRQIEARYNQLLG